MVKQTKSTKKPVTKTVAKQPAKKTTKKAAVKRKPTPVKVAFYPNLVTFLISTAAVMILFSLALVVTL